MTTSPETSGWRAGLRVGAGLSASTFALAISFGALARAEGWSPAAATVFSLTAFSGSAQFAVLTTLAGGSGLVAAVGAAALMNARYLPMGLAAGPSLKGGRIRRTGQLAGARPAGLCRGMPAGPDSTP